MNKIFVMIFMAGTLLALNTGCDKKSGDENSGEFVINAQVEDSWGFNDHITSVKALMYREDDDDKIEIASSIFENEGFKLTLPSTSPAYRLYVINEDFDENFKGTISNPQAMWGGIHIKAFNESEDYIGGLYLEDFEKDIYTIFIYVDGDVTIKGNIHGKVYEVEYDCSLKKGWNIMYEIFKEKELFYITNKPSDANLKWLFYYNPDTWKTYPDNFKKHRNLWKIDY